MIEDGKYNGPIDGLDRWMIVDGIQHLWNYHKDKSLLELIQMIIGDAECVFMLGPMLSDQQFKKRLYDKLREARAK